MSAFFIASAVTRKCDADQMTRPSRISSACGVGHVAVRLNRDDRIARIWDARRDHVSVEMIDELIQRLGADAARKAVFEEQQRPRMTLGQQAIKLLEVLQLGQIRVHPTPV